MTPLYVQDFGPLGTADDSGTINAALALARALNDPAQTTVILPAGTYRIQEAMVIGSNTRLVMTGARVIWNNAIAHNEMVRAYNDAPVFGYDGEHDWALEGGTLDGNRRNVADGRNTMAFGHCRNVEILGVHFTGCSEDHCIELNSSQSVWVYGCRFTDSAGSTEAVQLDGAFSTGTFPHHGAYDDTACDTVVIDSCVFRDGIVDGIGSHTVVAGHPHTNVTIRDCVLHVTGTALRLNNYVDVALDNVTGTAATWLVLTCDRQYVGGSGAFLPTPYVPDTPPSLDPPIGGPEPMHVSFYINDGGSGQIANAPAAPTEIFGNTKRRTAADLTGYTQARVMATVVTTGALTSRLCLRASSDDGATWTALADVGIGSTGFKTGAWTALPVAGDVWLRVDEVDGNGTADPAFGRIDAEFR